MAEAERLAEEHLAWLKTEWALEIEARAKAFRDGFIHGWKHGVEKQLRVRGNPVADEPGREQREGTIKKEETDGN